VAVIKMSKTESLSIYNDRARVSLLKKGQDKSFMKMRSFIDHKEAVHTLFWYLGGRESPRGLKKCYCMILFSKM
jgi:hypothetical protein